MNDARITPHNKPKRGRPPINDPFVYVTVGLTAADWKYVQTFCPGSSPSGGLRELVDRSRRFRRGNKQ